MENPFVKLFAIDFKDQKVRQYRAEICKLGVCLGRGEKAVSFCQLRSQEVQRPALCL